MQGKKIAAILLSAVLVVSLFAGCGNTSTTTGDAINNDSVIETEEIAASISDEVDEADLSKVNFETSFVSGNGKQDEATEAEGTDTNVGESTTTEDDLIISLVDQNLNKEDTTIQGTVTEKTPQEDYVDENGDPNVPFDIAFPDIFNSDDVEYADNAILIKVKNKYSEDTVNGLKEAGVGKMETMFALDNSTWYTAYLLKGTDVNEAMETVRDVSGVLVAEYNFKYETALAEGESAADAEVVGNPHYSDQWAKEKYGIRKAWHKHREKTEKETGTATGGGSSSVVVAVIDTGVDYEHEDLRNNMWKNVNETPNNGVDDDGNGYVDDYYGVDITNPYSTENISGMDDNGHGTHVAGIIAAENNDTGMVGYAYNTKIMNIKAGDASGYFMQNNVANAIIYAYEHGADVINMSFGGSASSIAVQDALAVAYSRCVLVASAGNDGSPNEFFNNNLPAPNYPAAFSYVLGVMSVGENNVESSFTNWDAYSFNSVEYEVYAPGEQMISTLPGNRYGKLSGTSMAAPVVSAQAAMLRSYYNDADTYSTKFIYGQIVGTAEQTVQCLDPKTHGDHNIPGVINFYEAITQIPTPEVSMSDYTIFDTAGYVADIEGITKGYTEYNNGDGIVDAGETLALGFTLRNRWGMSENTTVHIDVVSDGGVENPYVTILNNDINYKSIGTYSENDCGKLYTEDGEMWNGWENPFYIQIAKNCPNDYSVKLNVTITCENALNPEDETVYTTTDEILLTVRRGVPLSGKIEEDMTLTKDNYYIIENSLMIMEGATVTVEAGTQVQFWCSDPADSYADTAITYITVAGKFICEGTAEEPVELFPSGWMDRYRVEIRPYSNGYISLTHTNVVNPFIEVNEATNCTFTQNFKDEILYRVLNSGVVEDGYGNTARIKVDYAKDCAFYKLGGDYQGRRAELDGRFEGCIFVDSAINYSNVDAMENCVFYGNNNYWDQTYDENVRGGGSNSSWELSGNYSTYDLYPEYIYRNDLTGTTYIMASGGETYSIKDRIAKMLGGAIISFVNQEELLNLSTAINDYNAAKYPTASEERYIQTGLYKQEGMFYNYDGTSFVVDSAAITDTGNALQISTNYVGGYEYNEEYGYDEWYDEKWNRVWNIYGTEPVRALDQNIYNTIYEIPGEIYITNIELDEYLVNMDMEETHQIKATLTPYTADQDTLIYESQDESVITVDETGKVTPVGAGSTTVRVYAPDYAIYNYVTFNVVDVVELESLSFADGEEITVNVDEPQKLKLVYGPSYTTKKAVTYTTTDETVVTVDERGIITGLKEGQTIITVTGYNDITASITVNVVVPAEGIAFSADIYKTTIGESESKDFYPVITPANATNKTFVWESSNPEVCYVDEETGTLVALQTGTAVLRATLSGTVYTDEILVAVMEELVQTDIVKLKADKAQNRMYALLEDGTLWTWGSIVKAPTQIPMEENIVDFMVHSSDLYILDTEGTVYYYNIGFNESRPEDISVTKNTYFTPMTDIVAMADHYMYSGAFFAIDDNGYAWAWGQGVSGNLGVGTDTYVSNNEPMMVLIDEVITKIVVTGYETMFLTEEGYAYYAGESSGGNILTPRRVNTGVQDIYVYDGENAAMRCEDGIKIYQIDGQIITNNSVGANCYVHSRKSYYIADGELYVGDSSYVGSCTWMDVPGTVVEAYYVHDRLFIETLEGEIYALGSGTDFVLGTGNATTATTPTIINFGIIENKGTISLQGINDMELEEGKIPDSFEIRAGEPLVLDFSHALAEGSQWGYISLQDADGILRLTKTLDLDQLIIEPKNGFEAGYEYILTIPASALSDRAGNVNEAITLTFVCFEGELDADDTPEVDDSVTPDDETEVPEEDVVNDVVVNEELLAKRHYWTKEEVYALWKEFVSDGLNTRFYSNVILNRLADDDMTTWLRIEGGNDYDESLGTISFGGNYWGTTNETLINKQILDFDDYQSLYDINEGEILTAAPESTYPYVVEAYLEVDGELVDTVGKDLVTFTVEFNRDMDTSIPLEVRFGSSYPYAEYTIPGAYVDEDEDGKSRIWQGTMQLSTIIENGYQYWSVSNGTAAGTSLDLYTDWGRFPFKIDTTAAQALTMQAEVTDTGINLTWEQDSFETLAGYNVYRSTAEDGQYTKLNKTVIPAAVKEWFDDTVLPGQRYYYNFTVVESDFAESEPSGKVIATAMDTMAPNIYHSPIYHAFTGSNLVISADVTDNVAISSATLYYRTTGTDAWKTKTMTNLNDKYSAVIPSSDITVDGIEYYIVATDGITDTYKGSATEPYNITIQLAVADSEKGDVDGNGAIELKDALMVLMAINDRLNLTEEQFARANLNNDKELTASEALRILQYANGLISSVLP